MLIFFNPFLQFSFAGNFANATSGSYNQGCAPIYIDFDNFSAGEHFEGNHNELGVDVTIDSNGSNDVLMIFDSEDPTGGDTDLTTKDGDFSS